MSSRCAPALHYKVSGIGRFRLPIPDSSRGWQAKAPAPRPLRRSMVFRPSQRGGRMALARTIRFPIHVFHVSASCLVGS